MAGSRPLRGAAVLAIIAVSSVVWVVHRTVQRSQASNEWVVHTQEVLTAIESVLATMWTRTPLYEAVCRRPTLGISRRLVKLRARPTRDLAFQRT